MEGRQVVEQFTDRGAQQKNCAQKLEFPGRKIKTAVRLSTRLVGSIRQRSKMKQTLAQVRKCKASTKVKAIKKEQGIRQLLYLTRHFSLWSLTVQLKKGAHAHTLHLCCPTNLTQYATQERSTTCPHTAPLPLRACTPRPRSTR